ncbi:unnamed protein product [Paramecium sonneborni]|uniref:Uncharacterized protein n=1 Tax=Paramecium sonneborni TaxID=65129 RepID=A0A8S1PXW3_9CILI|nr:unnamed protein product [Paramecium sonneborni]
MNKHIYQIYTIKQQTISKFDKPIIKTGIRLDIPQLSCQNIDWMEFQKIQEIPAKMVKVRMLRQINRLIQLNQIRNSVQNSIQLSYMVSI